MNLKLSNIPTVIYICFVLHNFCEYHNTYVDEDLKLKLQKEIMKGLTMFLTQFTRAIFLKGK